MVFLILALLFLAGLFFVTSYQSALRALGTRPFRRYVEELAKRPPYFRLLRTCCPEGFAQGLFFSLSVAQQILRLGCVLCFTLFFIERGWFLPHSPFIPWPSGVVALVTLFFLFYGVGEFSARIVGTQARTSILRFFVLPTSFFLFITFPITYPFLIAARNFLESVDLENYQESMTTTNQEILEIIEEANISQDLDTNDRKLIGSVIQFRDRIAREVMVPRVDVFSLPATMSIREAARLLDEEGYSRTPVYQESADKMIGVLMYKEILKQYMLYEENGRDETVLDQPIERITKTVLYTPETKKISHLLQEFRKQQVHLAIVVDEYGGTEGIITIEDILEEIVGEIEDEYDVDESLFLSLPDGSWLVDGRMSILDIAEQMKIQIPPDGDYDTIGGFIFHKSGMIPPKGYILTEETFVIEILRSDDRRIGKVRITSGTKGEG